MVGSCSNSTFCLFSKQNELSSSLDEVSLEDFFYLHVLEIVTIHGAATFRMGQIHCIRILIMSGDQQDGVDGSARTSGRAPEAGHVGWYLINLCGVCVHEVC